MKRGLIGGEAKMESSSWCTGIQEHLALRVPNRPSSAIRCWQNAKAEAAVRKQESNLFQWSHHQENSSLTSQRRSPKCQRCFQVYIRKLWDKGRRVLQVKWRSSWSRSWSQSRAGSCWLRVALTTWGGSFHSHQGMICPRCLLPELR